MCLDDPTHSRRDILKLAALLSAAGALPLLSSLQARAAAEPDAPVRIGYLPITDATPSAGGPCQRPVRGRGHPGRTAGAVA